MLMLRNTKERSGDRSFFAVCLNWACAEWRIENGEWKMNAMAECCVGGQWPPLRLNVCKSLETVRRGHTPGHLLLPFGQFSRLAGRIPFASQVFEYKLAIKPAQHSSVHDKIPQTKPAHKERNLCMCRFSLAAKKNTGVSAPDCTQAASAAAFCRGNSAAIPPMD